MKPGSFPSAWVSAAQYERDRREQRYPKLIAAAKLELETATLDYQAWCAIAEWMETGRCALIGGWGGEADPPVTVISWALLEECAAKALASIEAKVERDTVDPTVQLDDLAKTRERCESVWCIHNAMVKQRESVVSLNRQTDQVKAAIRAKREGADA
jgi:hypothetical protein